MTALAARLAAPSRHGGDRADAFIVIVPSLPGFAFSPQRASLPAQAPSCRAARATLRASIGSDLPRSRALLRSFAVSCVGIRSTRSPRSIRNRSNEPDTCRQSSSAHTRSSSSLRAHSTNAPNPRRPTATVCWPSSSPVAADYGGDRVRALVGVRADHDHCLVLLHRQKRTAGGHGLLEALPRIYQVTPDIPDRRRATKQTEVRPSPADSLKASQLAAGRDPLLHAGRHRQKQ